MEYWGVSKQGKAEYQRTRRRETRRTRATGHGSQHPVERRRRVFRSRRYFHSTWCYYIHIITRYSRTRGSTTIALNHRPRFKRLVPTY